VSLSADGFTVASGAYLHDGVNGIDSGEVRIYSYDDETQVWNLRGTPIDGEAADDESGVAISLSNNGHVIVIGAWLNDGGESIGVLFSWSSRLEYLLNLDLTLSPFLFIFTILVNGTDSAHVRIWDATPSEAPSVAPSETPTVQPTFSPIRNPIPLSFQISLLLVLLPLTVAVVIAVLPFGMLFALQDEKFQLL
jgi:hypothetical protein